jgi:hypothetical protein
MLLLAGCIDDENSLFKSGQGYLHDPTTLSDQWLVGDDFYYVLQHWRAAFEAEWASMPKASESDVGLV